MNDPITRDDGLTNAEGVVMDHLVDAVNAFAKLDRQHPDEGRDFCDGICRCQDTLAVRIARRAFPIGWPIKDEAGNAEDRIPFRQDDVKAWLDACINVSRRNRDDPASRPEGTSERDFVCYVDAYQSIRTSLFGETLPSA